MYAQVKSNQAQIRSHQTAFLHQLSRLHTLSG
jgi:hypothetical protein